MDIQSTHPFWAIHPQPQQGELFESWIVRLSAENGVPVNTLVTQLGLEDIFGMVDDISPKSLQKLSQATGVQTEKILESHFSWYQHHSGFAFTTPYTVYGRNTTVSAREFKVCSECLSVQMKPYISQHWALEITRFCQIHRQPLIENCPECRKPFSFDSRPRQSFLPETCNHCGTQLKFRHKKHPIDFKYVLEFQNFLVSLKLHDSVLLEGCKAVSVQTFVRIVNRIIRCFENISNQQTFSKINKNPFNDVVLLDDRFAEPNRRVNALSIAAWIFADPGIRIGVLQRYIQQYVEYAIAVKVIAALSRTLEVLQFESKGDL